MKELYNFIHSDRFLKSDGLANEVPYYIYDYNPKEELIMREKIELIIAKSKVKIININLLVLILEYFEDEGQEALFECEEYDGTKLFIRDVISPIIEDGSLMELLVSKIEGYDVLFITGVGSVFQFIGLHEVFSKLGDKKVSIPVIGFYPGTYTMETLSLFNIFESKNYYRAFKINR
ncbi:BREX protein BrxB domain-containing protein [Clostridium sp. DJ247]|uniref:BREX protein BrxB domain-containing protein n=1 Tax=Clostridium sp. DJ247 TaxID=2726188 RepID=UPI001627EB31|nr:BREX protein BrxB domain-containing protein [Clostridium sp. DJ247]MBC2579373.1 DUF1788 domain-containing protein [Clostridium sp. DJ247]